MELFLRLPTGSEVCLPAASGNSPGSPLTAYTDGDSKWSVGYDLPSQKCNACFHIWSCGDSCAALKVLGCGSVLLEEPGVGGVYTLSGLAETDDSEPTKLTRGTRFFPSGRKDDGVFLLFAKENGESTDPRDRGESLNSSSAQVARKRPACEDVQTTSLSPFGLLQIEGDNQVDPHLNRGAGGVRLRDLVPEGLQLAFVCNYYVDVPFLVGECPALADSGAEVVLLHGFKDSESQRAVSESVERLGLRRWSARQAVVADPYGTHHSKAFILKYPAGLRVVLLTANLIRSDCRDKTQAVWWQDFPPKSPSSGRSDFEDDLLWYLGRLEGLGDRKERIVAACKAHDFSSAAARLLMTVPGRHTGANLARCGHMQLRRLLSEETFPDEFRGAPVVAQFSSIGSTNGSKSNREKWRNELQESFSAGRSASGGALGAASSLQFVWPTAEEVRCSIEGYAAGGSLPGRQEHLSQVSDLLHRWDGGPAGRARAAPHIKSYCRYRDSRVAWMVITSSNMSRAAWGELQKSGSQLYCKSYELGLLLLPHLLRPRVFNCTPEHPPPTLDAPFPPSPISGITNDGKRPCTGSAEEMPTLAAMSHPGDAVLASNKQCWCLPLPYCLPPLRYSRSDRPWAVDGHFPEPDNFGRSWAL